MSGPAPIAEEFVALAEEIDRRLPLPPVRTLWLPGPRENPEKSAEFGAVVLEDGSVGLMFVLLGDTLQQMRERGLHRSLAGQPPAAIARGFASTDPVEKALGLGALNAISQHLFGAAGWEPPGAADSLASLEPQPGDRVGMVGYFPPLVEHLGEAGIDLVVVELKAELVQRSEHLLVTLDPSALEACNKVLCTSTVLLNDTIDRVLAHCRSAERVALVGPSAGFLPDPLFDRGVDTVGGNRVLDVEGFLDRCEREEKWGETARKYLIRRQSYPGFRALLARAG
ncbi:MAG: hypothetical protein Kow006_16760 [Gammaproteobacteria bacterium]